MKYGIDAEIVGGRLMKSAVVLISPSLMYLWWFSWPIKISLYYFSTYSNAKNAYTYINFRLKITRKQFFSNAQKAKGAKV